MIEALFVDQYLRDESQRELGNRGVPPSIRHESRERGSKTLFRFGRFGRARKCPRGVSTLSSKHLGQSGA